MSYRGAVPGPPRKKSSVDDRITALSAMAATDAPLDRAAVIAGLRHRTGVVVAAAVRVVRARGLDDLDDELAAAFTRLADDGVTSLPQVRDAVFMCLRS